MFPSNLLTLLRMSFDPRLIKFLVKIYRIFNVNEKVSPLMFIKMMREFMRKEKIVRHDNVYVVNSLFPPMPSKAFQRYLNAPSDMKTPFSDIVNHRRKAPVTCFLKITDRCVYNCVYCSAKFSDGKDELSTDQWIKVIGDLQDLGCVYIGVTGGEPMLCEDLEKIISSIDERSTSVVFTNGTDLTLERAKSLKKAGLFCASISLDSPEEEVNNNIRGSKQAFSTALSAVSNARKAGLYTIMQSVVFREGLKRANMRKLFRLAKKNGAHESRIHQPAPAGVLLNEKEPTNFCFSPEEKQKLYQIQEEANRKFFNFPKASSFPFSEGPEKFGCSAGVYHAFITEKGDLTPCDFIPLSFGNVLREDLTVIYNKMNRHLRIPKESCLAKRVADAVKGKNLPVSPEESAAICQSLEGDSYGRFFQNLRR